MDALTDGIYVSRKSTEPRPVLFGDFFSLVSCMPSAVQVGVNMPQGYPEFLFFDGTFGRHLIDELL